MSRSRLRALLILAPAVAFYAAGVRSDDRPGAAPAAQKKKGKTELESTGWGTLTGVVLFDGTPPTPADFNKTREDFKRHPDHPVCQMGDTLDPTWRINADKRVRNVVIWIAPPAGKYFKQPADTTWTEQVVIDQPHCSFDPHVTVAFPGRYDYRNKRYVPSGQKLVVRNSAPMKHNVRTQGSPDRNPAISITQVAADQKGHEFTIQPDSEPIALRCDIHKWMTGYVWAFDHPYAAVTDKDGKFEIKKVPSGADMDIYYWHESFGKTPRKLKTVKLKDGENKEEIQLSEK
jgi:hypothetical protein